MIDFSTNAPTILAIVGSFVGCAVLVVGLRVFVRSIMLKMLGPDDYVMVVATMCAIGSLICFVGETKHGVGRHNRDISKEQMVIIKRWVFWHNIFVTLGISLVKISVACFLVRVVPQKGYKIFLYSTMVFLAAFTITCLGTLIWACIPIRASWVHVQGAKCFTMREFTNIGLFNSCINITTDILFATLPIPIIWKLHANIRTRLSLCGVLSLGYAACAAAIVKANIQSHVLSDHDSYRNDTYAIWNVVELCVGILAASLPALRPLFRSVLETAKTLGGSRKTTNAVSGVSGIGNGSARRHYYMQGQGIALDHSPHCGAQGKYMARISSRCADWNDSRGHSEERFPIDEDFSTRFQTKRDGDHGSSTENILPLQGMEKGITKTVKVSLQRS